MTLKTCFEIVQFVITRYDQGCCIHVYENEEILENEWVLDAPEDKQNTSFHVEAGLMKPLDMTNPIVSSHRQDDFEVIKPFTTIRYLGAVGEGVNVSCPSAVAWEVEIMGVDVLLGSGGAEAIVRDVDLWKNSTVAGLIRNNPQEFHNNEIILTVWKHTTRESLDGEYESDMKYVGILNSYRLNTILRQLK